MAIGEQRLPLPAAFAVAVAVAPLPLALVVLRRQARLGPRRRLLREGAAVAGRVRVLAPDVLVCEVPEADGLSVTQPFELRELLRMPVRPAADAAAIIVLSADRRQAHLWSCVAP
jgi:hypothetical protein